MKRNNMLKILNPVLGLLLLNQIVTAVFHNKLSHEAYEILHGGGGIFLTIGVLLHLFFNWNWIKFNFFNRTSRDKIKDNSK